MAIEHERHEPTDLTLSANTAALPLLVCLVPPAILMQNVMDWVAEADLHGLAGPDALEADGALYRCLRETLRDAGSGLESGWRLALLIDGACRSNTDSTATHPLFSFRPFFV